MGNRAEENTVFTAFIATYPMFADVEVANWIQPQEDPPDIECHLVDGRTIGLELVSWVDENQIKASKDKEGLERPFLRLLADEPNNTENFWAILLSVKKALKPMDASEFRTQLLSLISEIDEIHSKKPEWEQRPWFEWTDFQKYRLLNRYLRKLEIHPWDKAGGPKGELDWITFDLRGGFYSPEPMVDALRLRIQGKVNKYPTKLLGVQEFYLLVHYDKAFVHNTPVIAPGFDYAEAIAVAEKRLGSFGVFDRILVFVGITGQGFRIYP